MRMKHWWVGGLMLASSPALAQVAPPVGPPHEPADVYIRHKAGLPPGSAKGNIEILDVGHSPFSTMLSIVANRTPQGWHVSYACAGSEGCTADRSADRSAKLNVDRSQPSTPPPPDTSAVSLPLQG